MLAIAEAGGHSPSLAEAGEGHHLPGLGNLEGTSLSQGLTACKRNKQTDNKFGVSAIKSSPAFKANFAST